MIKFMNRHLSIIFCAILLSPNLLVSQNINRKIDNAVYKQRHRYDTTSVSVKVAMLHMFPQLGMLQSNIELVNRLTLQALQRGANIVVAPELATTGYSITATQVRGGLGLTAPFSSLSYIKELAGQYNAYIVVGIAEIGVNDSLYNSAVMFKPDGSYFVQRKRGLAGWNARGNVPFNVVPTPYGNIGIAICSDTYLMDWMRIMAINGADLVLTPANWWGSAGQLNTWTTRAYENGVHMVVANRWGSEVDKRFDPPYTYNMNDAPSAVIQPGPNYTISPGNQVQFVYRAEQTSHPNDTVLIQVVKIPANDVISSNQTWMLTARQPTAYPQISNSYYRPDRGNKQAPGLPPGGYCKLGVMSFWPSTDPKINLNKMYSYWSSSARNADVLVLPAMGISIGPIDSTNPKWTNMSPWTDLQKFIENSGIQLLITSTYSNYGSSYPNRETSIVMQPHKPIIAIPAIHGWLNAWPAPVPPIYIDTDSARIGIVLDHDILLPETALDLVKSGSDIVVFPFDFGVSPLISDTVKADNWPYNLLQTYSNIVCHIAGSNDFGMGGIVENGGGFIQGFYTTNADAGQAFKIVKLNSQLVRTKYLNAYYDFDLDALLGYANVDTLTVPKASLPASHIKSTSSSINDKAIHAKENSHFNKLTAPRRDPFEKQRLLSPPGSKHK